MTIKTDIKSVMKIMGKIVTSKKKFRKVFGENDIRSWISVYLDDPIVGWVVGVRTIYNGIVDYDIDGAITFRRTKAIRAILIAPYPTCKPILVPPDEISIGGEPQSPYTWKGQYVEECKKFASEDAKSRKRDSRGRFKCKK